MPQLIVDIRSGSDEARQKFVDTFKAEVRALAERRHLGLLVTQHATLPPRPAIRPCRMAWRRRFQQSVGGDPIKLASGAGHDGTAMAKLCPIAMMFVRCRGGISHNPAEYASPADMGLAVAALIRFIENVKL